MWSCTASSCCSSWSYVFLLIVWPPQCVRHLPPCTAENTTEEEPRAAGRGWLQNATRKVPLGRYMHLSCHAYLLASCQFANTVRSVREKPMKFTAFGLLFIHNFAISFQSWYTAAQALTVFCQPLATAPVTPPRLPVCTAHLLCMTSWLHATSMISCNK